MAADTLWNPELHRPFIKSLSSLLKKSSTAEVHLVAGLHTGLYTLQSFMDSVCDADFRIVSAIEREICEHGRSRPWSVSRAEDEGAFLEDRERRRWVVWITLKWKKTELLY